STKGNLLSLVGLAITALLTLSSTTLASNAMAGLMIRMERGFRPGDFVRVGEYFGRVSERGLFHTEIQTEDRDLVTLPNMFLATNPVRVVRSSGTIISAELSLGYDVSHATVEPLLIKAASDVGLVDPFVWLTELHDHAVGYRVCGFCEDVKTLVSVRSKLRASVLDTVHGAGIEIVSPSFMNQRPAPREEPVIPRPQRRRASVETTAPEEIVFDKAEAAGHKERLHEQRKALEARLHELEGELRGAKEEQAQQALSREVEQVSHELADVDDELKALEEEG
ncbi:MAG: mechanosensitive ion channel domain-containing protein, partial [Phycisphaerales bacterium]